MRVAFQTDQLWFSAPGGIGTYVRELLSRLSATPDVDLVPFSSRWTHPSPVIMPMRRGDTWPHMRLPIQMLYPSWSLLRMPYLPRRFGDLDIVHATNHATIPPARRDQRLVVTVHDLAFERFPELFPERWLRLYRRGLNIAAREADIILVPSSFTARELRERGIERPIRVTPLAAQMPVEPVEPDIEEARAREPDGPFVLAVGTIEPRKNLRRLVNAFHLAVEQARLPHTLVLAGAVGWHQDDLLAEIQSDPRQRVRYVGHLDEDRLDVFRRDADAAAYVSVYEGFGLPVLESLAVGTPTVASSIPAITEVAGHAALLVDPLDERDIADGLVRILTDDGLRSDLRAKGPTQAASFSWEATARATLDAYRDAMERAGT